MRRRLIVLGLVMTLVGSFATLAALQADTGEVKAQTAAYPMTTLCLEYTTGLYKGSFSGTCPPGHQKLTLPDAYPLTLCASYYDSFLRKPLANGQCPPSTRVRIQLPSSVPYAVCYVYATGRLRVPVPYPNGACTAGSRAVSFSNAFEPQNDAYQTLGNVDIDVPASAGALSNDGGVNLTVTAFDAASANGGVVTMNSDGSFTYTPPPPSPLAFTGDDSFTYTVEEALGDTEVVTVTIEVLSPAVWFVNSAPGGPGDGRRLTPFNTIDAVNDDSNDPDQQGDFIFLYESLDAYEGGFFLESGQSLVGQEVDLGEILVAVLEAPSTLQGSGGFTVPPFLALPPENPNLILNPLLTNADTNAPLSMAGDSLAAGVFIASSETPAVVAGGVDNTTLDRVSAIGGNSTANAIDGQTGVLLDDSSMTIIDSIVRGGEAIPILNGSSSLQGPLGPIFGGDGVAALSSTLDVLGSTVSGGNAQTLQSDFAVRDLQGCCGGSDGGEGILALVSHVSVSDGSTITGGDGGDDGGSGGDGIFSDSFETFANLQGPVPVEPNSVAVSSSSVSGGDGSDDSGEFGGDGGAGIAGIFVVIDVSEGSVVTGGDGGEGDDYGGFGGNGIEWNLDLFLSSHSGESALQGPPGEPIGPAITVLDSTVDGGHGGSGDVESGGDGGAGIVLGIAGIIVDPIGSTLAGEDESATAMLVDGATITGGNGGSADFAGFGGPGIIVISNFGILAATGPSGLQGLDFTAVTEVIDSTVTGGVGGEAAEGGGRGGDGIIFGSPFFGCPLCTSITQEQLSSSLQGLGSFGLDLEVSGSTVSGGPGGPGGDSGGWGGSGITNLPLGILGFSVEKSGTSLQGLGLDEMNVYVSDSTVLGADGADSSTFGGDGGFGIFTLAAYTEVDAASIVTGGVGGSGIEAGLGGEGIFAVEGELDVLGGSTITGGAGGVATAFSTPGGDGIYGEATLVTISDSTAIGGTGGGGIGIDAARGGHGVHVSGCSSSCETLIAMNATITGGDGGSSDQQGGSGGEGILIEDDDAFVTNSTVTGGNGSGGAANGASAIRFLQSDSNSYVLDIQSNTLIGGTNVGGSVQTVSLNVNPSGSGSVCLNAVGNTPTGAFSLNNSGAGTLGITQVDLDALSADNNNVTVLNSFGTVTFECVIAP